MKNTRAISMVLLSATCGVGAVILAAQWLAAQPATSVKRIAVAGGDVDIGQRLSPDVIVLAEWPSGSIPPGAFTTPASLAGRVAKNNLVRGEPVTEGKLAPAGASGGLSAVIAEGKRAITVRVNDVIGVAGFALPGNFVDIIVNTKRDANTPDSVEQDISKIVLERILVLAVAQEVGRDDTKPRLVNAVTLEVTPEQAEKLDLARSVGSLSLVLRNQVDPQPGITQGATKNSMLGSAPVLVIKSPLTSVRPAPKPQPAIVASGQCSGVLNGVGGSQECFE
ncbi:MAG TPA: Flp pilus assembly protein CpaB [Burkholderiaceae bacterium]